MPDTRGRKVVMIAGIGVVIWLLTDNTKKVQATNKVLTGNPAAKASDTDTVTTTP